MKKFGFVALLCGWVAVLSLGACSVSETEKTTDDNTLTLLTWNIHNLFDANDDGFEYKEFTSAGGWSQEKYQGRLNDISTAIGMLPSLPDVIILQEVESQKVLEELAVTLQQGYNWCHFANNHGSSIGLGVISRLPLMAEKTHSILIGNETTPRPVLEVRVNAGGEEMVIFACHWKSKLGGDDATESIRRASAKVILRRIRELWENEPDLGIIVAGDLNTNYDDFSRRGAETVCALLPDSPKSFQLAGTTQSNFLVITESKPPEPAYFPNETVIFYSPWINELENGTYFYQGSWETIDHFLVSRQFFDDTGWEYAKTSIVDFEPFSGLNSTPVPYNPRTGFGLSDHLPLLLRLVRN